MWGLFHSDERSAWHNPSILERFPHYFGLLRAKTVAYYKIAKKISLPVPKDTSLDDLWRLHDEGRALFLKLLAKEPTPEIFENQPLLNGPSFLDLKVRLAHEYLKCCIFCENQCRVDRSQGKLGKCGVPLTASVASAFEHFGEESILVGSGGSGTVFFEGCTFNCAFCQNYDISQEWSRTHRRTTDPEQLSAILNQLHAAGVININYVGGDPSSNLHVILESLARSNFNANLCQIWNSNFYNSPEIVKLLLEVIDLWLPDFKYGNDECARKYSKINKYVEVLQRNLRLAHDEGSGEIIIRHLVLPNHLECCTKPILSWIAGNLPNAVVNIMAQYHPEYQAANFPEIARRPSAEEMREVRRYATELGIIWENL